MTWADQRPADGYGAVSALAGGRPTTSWTRRLTYGAAGCVAAVGLLALLELATRNPNPHPLSMAASSSDKSERLAIINETTGKLFCQSPCHPQIVPKNGDTPVHRNKGGVCWDLGFKTDVASAPKCQQECAEKDGCQMWDYRAKRSDKRCNLCSTKDHGAGKRLLLPRVARFWIWHPSLVRIALTIALSVHCPSPYFSSVPCSWPFS